MNSFDIISSIFITAILVVSARFARAIMGQKKKHKQ